MKRELRNNKIALLILILSAGPMLNLHAAGGASADSAGEKLPELALYKRCFTQLTGRQPSRTAPLTTKVRNGELSAANACMAVLNAISLDASTGLVSVSTTTLATGDDPDTLKYQVLRKFNDFHRTWFSGDSFFNAGATLSNNQIYDETGSALYITRALFAPLNYSSTVTYSGELEAIRSAGSQNLNNYAYLGATVASFHNYTATGANGSTLQPTTSSNLGSQTGDLLGIRPMESTKAAMTRATRTTKTTQSAVHNHQGGGVLGSAPFLLLNYGLAENTTTDGGLYLGRRHAKNVFKDLLCRDIPPLRELDAVSFVTPAASQTASTPAFRTAATCMACHASLDNFAGTTRALYLSQTSGYISGTTYLASIHMQAQTESKPAETSAPDSDSDFGKRPANGKLLFRSYNGDLIDESVTGLASMGDKIAQTNDLYVCAAKRYFEYFTGLAVSLQDTGNPLSSTLSAADEYYRNEVIKLGLSLKNHGSLKTLVQDILNLELYQSRSQRSRFETTGTTTARKSSSGRRK